MGVSTSGVYISSANQIAAGILPAASYEDFAWWSNQTETITGTGDTDFLVADKMVTTNAAGTNANFVLTTKAVLDTANAGSLKWNLSGISLGATSAVLAFGLSSSNTTVSGTSRIRLYITGDGVCTLQVGTSVYGSVATTTEFDSTTIQNLTSITLTWNGSTTCTAAITDGITTANLSIATNYPTAVKLFFGSGGSAAASNAASYNITDITVTP